MNFESLLKKKCVYYWEHRDRLTYLYFIVGENLNLNELERVRSKTENLINQKISTLILTPTEYEKLKSNFIKEPILILLETKG